MSVHPVTAEPVRLDPENRAALADLNARFAWALDLHDWDALSSVLAADVRYVSAGRELHGVPAVIAAFRARDAARTTRHGLGNLLLEVGGHGTVTGRGSWHTFARNGPADHGVPLYMVADFHDVYARDAHGVWRIAERVIVPVFRDETRAPLADVGHTT